MDFQISDEVGSSTLIEYDLTMTQGSSINSEQGLQTPFGPVSGSVSLSSTPTLDTLVQDQLLLKKEASKQSPDQVKDIEPSTPSTPFKRKLFQNNCQIGVCAG